jgi:hypothetical protein
LYKWFPVVYYDELLFGKKSKWLDFSARAVASADFLFKIILNRHKSLCLGVKTDRHVLDTFVFAATAMGFANAAMGSTYMAGDATTLCLCKE